MIQGLRSAIYPVADLEAGKAFYSAVLGHGPYFDEPFYVGYRQAGLELGLIPDGQPGASGPTVYWGVADIRAEYARLREIGAKGHEEPRDVGGDIFVASVLDPFGNVFGIIRNPHFEAGKAG